VDADCLGMTDCERQSKRLHDGGGAIGIRVRDSFGGPASTFAPEFGKIVEGRVVDCRPHVVRCRRPVYHSSLSGRLHLRAILLPDQAMRWMLMFQRDRAVTGGFYSPVLLETSVSFGGRSLV